MKIEEAIQQRRFSSSVHKAQVNIIYTSAWLNQLTAHDLKPFGISVQQFNILRILRGLHPEPATVKLLMERMLDKMSNASRLVEKLKQKGLVERRECSADRRRVDITITDKGLDLINAASEAVRSTMHSHMEVLTEAEAETLSHLLDKLRTHEVCPQTEEEE